MILLDFESVSIETTPETALFAELADHALFWCRTMS
jgi:hypothetical protein